MSVVSDCLFRHPSNLMLDRLTGHIVHIDFGDCFEVVCLCGCVFGVLLFECACLLSGCNDKRKVSGENTFPFDTNVGEGNGGQLTLRVN